MLEQGTQRGSGANIPGEQLVLDDHGFERGALQRSLLNSVILHPSASALKCSLQQLKKKVKSKTKTPENP